MNRSGGIAVTDSGGSWPLRRADPAAGEAAPAGFGRSSQNTLLEAARPLLNMMVQIRTGAQDIDPARLRERLIHAVRRFQEQAQAASAPVESIVGARYCLCTALDESAALTRWGGDGIWSAHSLLVIFHNETWGGEKFFQLLARLIQDPAQHWPLIELQFHCLALGFEGRYRVLENGHAQLEGLKRRLRKLLLDGAAPTRAALAGNWLDPEGRTVAQLRRWLPLWAWMALATLLTAGVYIALLLMLNGRLEQGDAVVNSIHLPELNLLAARPGPAALATWLADDIRRGALSVDDAEDRHRIILHGSGLFDSGQATVRPVYQAVLEHVAAALDQLPGRVRITGYTDNQPIHNTLFATNEALSLARARRVAEVLQQRVPGLGRRIEVLGLGESHPVASNDQADGRALNRRVEIALFPQERP